MTVYRWDLDKTYLDTNFESFRGLVRAATEPAHRKRALPGASALLRALGADPQNVITVVSGSPTQMRGVISEKLRLDGIRFDDLVLKDNIGNVKRGRFRAVRGQLGYKLPALLRARNRVGGHHAEVLFGDDVEADALVYSLYADAIAGRIGAAGVSRVMEQAGAYDDEIDAALEALSTLSRNDAVERIIIRTERGVPANRMADLGPRVVPIRSWWQAALVLMQMGHLDKGAVQNVLLSVYEGEQRDPWAIGALAQDVVRRGWISAEDLRGLDAPEPLQEAICSAVNVLGGQGVQKVEPLAGPIDYLALLDSGAWNKRGRADTGG